MWASREARQRARIERRARWHRWFAWHPVIIHGVTVWLETIERRGGFDHSKNRAHSRAPWRWQYRIPTQSYDPAKEVREHPL